MQVNNVLVEDSFRYTEEKENLLVRSEEIGDFSEVIAYCDQIDESIQYNDSIWEVEVQEGITFAEWLFSQAGEANPDDRARIMTFINNAGAARHIEGGNETIRVSLGLCDDAVSDQEGYINKRREILAGISNVQEYEAFMQSCFLNSCFADNILSDMKYIKDFAANAKEITDNLSVLNDEAVELYYQYHDNLKMAIDILGTKLRACSPDPKHKKELVFPFVYDEIVNGESVARIKRIVCSPHLKLLRGDSDLRIYFYWCDSQVGHGKKVLVGSIGRHPY